jgi:hypothetical protein
MQPSVQPACNRARHSAGNATPDPAFLPKAPTRVLGLKVRRAYPDSVGMGLGFSLQVAAGFEEARRLLLTDPRGRAPVSLLGCHCFYRP